MIGHQYDHYYGRPPLWQRRRMAQAVKNILDVNSWPQFFRTIYLACPSPNQLHLWLRDSVRNSLKKKYHSANTDFSRIQSSGVSKILQKGETYATAPNLARILIENSWMWQHDVLYLDAHLLLYTGEGHQKHEFFECVDYMHTLGLGGLIQHSGDVLNPDKNSGSHTININMEGLGGSSITAIYVVLSAWNSDLRTIRQPYVRMVDPDTALELCRYNVEDRIGAGRGDQTAIIMCKIIRTGNRWKVVATGHFGRGRANEIGYQDLQATIAKLGGAWK
eukprot:TRINITY_DN6865_c0_g1_i17.p1 TRINITY_DN6865_c0_g1~~TRINITY_DN6865_c0_g1_i17.p1  ORF type:complete len:277 (-),score=68.81 TRINITY_DN6865_c0_g1_i17:258-1088(-)